ncbi:membrane protein YpdK, partial [Klebsiella pneumoniae]
SFMVIVWAGTFALMI